MHHSLADYLLDAVQNSIEAGATNVTVDIRQKDGRLDVYIGDDGKGMDEAELAKALDPFYSDGKKHSQRKVGLGLPFFKQAAEAGGGMFEISSEKDFGTSIHASFDSSHWDCPPLGDIPGTVLALMLHEADYELKFSHAKDQGYYSVTKSDLLDNLGDLDSGDSLSLARQYLRSLEEDL